MNGRHIRITLKMYQKNKPTRCNAYLRGAKDSPCSRCGVNDGTVVGAHYTGLRQHTYGKGTGMKPHDHAVAYLCRECHEYFDRNLARKSAEVSEEFLHCIIISQTMFLRSGGKLVLDNVNTLS